MSRMPPSLSGGFALRQRRGRRHRQRAGENARKYPFHENLPVVLPHCLRLRFRLPRSCRMALTAASARSARAASCALRAISAKRNGACMSQSVRSRQQPLARHMVELQPDAVGILEQQRVIARRPLILARRADDLVPSEVRKACSSSTSARSRARKQRWCSPTRFCSKAAPACSGDGARIADRGAAADAVIDLSRYRSSASARETAAACDRIRASVRNSTRSEKYARCR